jgi:hypothetical protein
MGVTVADRIAGIGGALLSAVLLTGPLAAPQAFAAGAQSPAKFAARALDGAWNRYPDVTNGVDPTVQPPPPDIPPPPLKAEHLGPWQEHQRQVAEANRRGEPPVTGYVRCLPDGMPAVMMAMFPLEVLQSPGRITIIEEAYNQVRRIYLDEPQIPIEDAEPGFWGHSIGRWEGDTLLVDTVGIKENVRFRDVPHSSQMRISERIRLLSADYLEDRITVTDPVYLAAPWSWVWKYQRKPGYKLYEYVCEDNREYADPDTGAQRLRFRPLGPQQPASPGK